MRFFLPVERRATCAVFPTPFTNECHERLHSFIRIRDPQVVGSSLALRVIGEFALVTIV